MMVKQDWKLLSNPNPEAFVFDTLVKDHHMVVYLVLAVIKTKKPTQLLGSVMLVL